MRVRPYWVYVSSVSVIDGYMYLCEHARFLPPRHVEVLKAWLASHKPLILCGPPGSGKTMTLTSTLQAMPNLVLASLNFSSSTDPNLILQVTPKAPPLAGCRVEVRILMRWYLH